MFAFIIPRRYVSHFDEIETLHYIRRALRSAINGRLMTSRGKRESNSFHANQHKSAIYNVNVSNREASEAIKHSGIDSMLENMFV